MQDKIIAVLKIIEQKHNVEILYACESGSRAWGFDSKDSDYDIRFVYVRKTKDYLTVFPNEQLHIDHNNSKVCKDFLKHELDFVGWDAKKVFYQFSKGNPDMISWFFSPIVYKFSKRALITFKQLGSQFFKQKAAYYHYMHMAQKNYNQYIKNPELETVKVKKYLYVLRPLLACMWIELYRTEPPMIFEKIYSDATINKKLTKEMVYFLIIELIYEKRHGIELGERPRMKDLDTFCEKYIQYYSTLAGNINVKELIENSYQNLDKSFRNLVSLYN